MEWMEYTIKPSSYISGLCYSVLRVEPFTSCSYGCIYCYARWYRGPHGRVEAKPWWPRLWRRLARLAGELEPRPWFRLSTLSEPFQEIAGGEPHPFAALALREALRREVPLVVNTRSASAARGEILGLLQGLADRGLVVVQVSLSPPGLDRLMEPGAPSTWTRLEAIERLAEHAVPVAARVQPVAPGLEEQALRLAQEAMGRGAAGLISEPLRETRRGLLLFYRLAGVEPEPGLEEWEPYQLRLEPGREPLLHPPLQWRLRMHRLLAAAATGRGGFYAPCKDAWLYEAAAPEWRPGTDCCLLGALRRRRWPRLLLRLTLHEYAYWRVVLGGDGSWEGFLEWCRGSLAELGYRCGSMLDELPRWLRRPLRLHEARLRRLVEKGDWARLLGLSPAAAPGDSGVA